MPGNPQAMTTGASGLSSGRVSFDHQAMMAGASDLASLAERKAKEWREVRHTPLLHSHRIVWPYGRTCFQLRVLCGVARDKAPAPYCCAPAMWSGAGKTHTPSRTRGSNTPQPTDGHQHIRRNTLQPTHQPTNIPQECTANND